MGASESTPSGQILIEHIRRNDYMIGLEMSPEVRTASKSLRGQLGNALQLLAADLYASETHFLLEHPPKAVNERVWASNSIS